MNYSEHVERFAQSVGQALAQHDEEVQGQIDRAAEQAYLNGRASLLAELEDLRDSLVERSAEIAGLRLVIAQKGETEDRLLQINGELSEQNALYLRSLEQMQRLLDEAREGREN